MSLEPGAGTGTEAGTGLADGPSVAAAAPARRGWLRRNLLAVITIVIAIPALVFVLLGLPIIDRSGRAETYAGVSYGDTAESGGYSFTLVDSAEFVGTGEGPDGNQIPIGSSLIGVLLDVAPTEDADPDAGCTTELTSRVGGDRTWIAVISPEDFSYGVGEENTEYCILDGEPFTLEVVFLTPTGTYDDATLDVATDLQHYLRFELAPAR